MQDRSKEDISADFDSQGASARPGGEAQGGIEPRSEDMASPAATKPADRAARRKMRDLGFGDDKGADIS